MTSAPRAVFSISTALAIKYSGLAEGENDAELEPSSKALAVDVGATIQVAESTEESPANPAADKVGVLLGTRNIVPVDMTAIVALS